MKIERIISLATAAAMGLCLCGCSEEEPAESSEAEFVRPSPRSIAFDWQNAAQSKLTGTDAGSNAAFDLIDLDHDNIPEIIISPDTEPSTACEIFSISGGEISTLGTIGMNGTFRYLPTMDILWEEFTGGSFTLGKFVKIDDGALEQILSYSDNSSSASTGATITHEINGNNVTLPEYDEAMKEYKEAKTVAIGRKYSFGESAVSYAVHCSESWGAVLTPGEKSLFKEQLAKNMNAFAAVNNTDGAFELCDLNGDEVPELIISQGTFEGAFCEIYYINNKNLSPLEGTFGMGGKLKFDFDKSVFYVADSASGNSCWTLTGADISNFTASGSTMECGRKYLLNADSVTEAFR